MFYSEKATLSPTAVYFCGLIFPRDPSWPAWLTQNSHSSLENVHSVSAPFLTAAWVSRQHRVSVLTQSSQIPSH